MYYLPELSKQTYGVDTVLHSLYTWKLKGFPNSSVGKESACNAGDPGSIPGSSRSSGGLYSPWGRKESDMTERLSLSSLINGENDPCSPLHPGT